MSTLIKARELLGGILEAAQVDAGHGIGHADLVLEHANKALQHEGLPATINHAIRLAALLHDADDSKFFPNNTDYQNARYILDKIGANDLIELVIKMISLVSCSKNGNKVVKPEWLLIPRFADRLEAMGRIGIVRCWQFTKHKDRPVFLDSTPRPCSLQEVRAVATPERFAQYTGGSDSMVDHFYDKLLHLVGMETTNEYICREAQDRHLVLVNFCIQFGRAGVIDEEEIKCWEAAELPNKTDPVVLRLE
jgi:uncharacterized protein